MSTRKSAGTVIRNMYNYCCRHGALSDDSKTVMSEYFKRTSRLRSGGRRRRRSKAQI